MKIEQVKKLLANLHDKSEYVIHIRNLKKALYHELVLKKVHRVIKFNLNASLKPYINLNTNLRKNKNNFFKLINNAVFTKTMVNIRKPRDTKLAITEKKTIGVRTKLSYYKSFSKRFVSFRNEKTEILINKAVCLGLSILELSKI